MELREFIVKAKKHTYASGDSAKKLDDKFEEFTFSEGEYSYRDRYYARDPNPFGGEEIVLKNNEIIWMMNYYGRVVNEKIPNKEIYSFLRKAMSLVDEKIPFRGPKSFKEGKLRYVNKVKGDVNNFKGTEKITFRGKVVYILEYNGGRVKE